MPSSPSPEKKPVLASRSDHKHARPEPNLDSPIDASPEGIEGLEKALALLRSRTSHDFSAYKKSTILRRLERRMGIHQIKSIVSYVNYLQENPQELDLLFKELLIGVTSFFRDAETWETLREKTLPDLMNARTPGPFRAWVAGCSTGEEAYSLAITLREVLDQLPPSFKNIKCQIFASDLHKDAIAKARKGFYHENTSTDVSPERLHRFFTKEKRGYRINPEIREMVIFSAHNLIMDPTFTRLDFLSCRNLLIYFTPELQKRLLPILRYSLNPGGILMLGSAETVGSQTALFSTLDAKSRIFQRDESAAHPKPFAFTPTSSKPTTDADGSPPPRNKKHPSLQSLAEQLILQRYTPATVLTDEKGNIIYISGRTGAYLEPAVGKANWNIFAMAREGLRYELTHAFMKSLRDKSCVAVTALKIEDSSSPQYADFTVEQIEASEPLAGMLMITFSETASAPNRRNPRSRNSQPPTPLASELQLDLERSLAELQSTRERMHCSQVELRSANEDMQSANEELTTSKEEMQSLNEELQIVNAELREKLDELSRSNSDMKNLLESTEVATLFLDNDLHVRRFTAPVATFIKLIPSDVGRPITDLSSELIYPELPEDARMVLSEVDSTERSVRTRDDRWFTARIMPYRAQDRQVDGVVITFWDITEFKILEEKLRHMQVELEKRLTEQSLKTDEANTELKAARKLDQKAT